MEFLLTNIGQLATPRGRAAQSGARQGEILKITDASIGIENGKIAYVGANTDALNADRIVDCGGKLVTPGLVDCHTHLVFGGWRQHEMALKLQGVPYLDILKQGGGILNTVESTRSATEQQLFEKSAALLREMSAFGATTVECKSGYGLDTATELKQLRVARRLAGLGLADVVPTFMGAHAVPREFGDDRAAYLRLVCEEMLPAVAAERLAEFCDVFCEPAVFTADETAAVLNAAKALGFGLKLHGDELAAGGGAELSATLGCVSAEHLIQASDDGIAAMAEHGVIAVLLPATSFYLDKPYARARAMVAADVAVAVATDFNPGSSPSLNLQFAMNLACLRYRLTPAEALTAVTLNAAAALRRAQTLGSIEPGKQADLVVWDAPDLDYIFYRYGSNLVSDVYKNGKSLKT